MNYSKSISAAYPGLIIILVDQSGSMSLKYGSNNQTKASVAATTVNKVIYEIMLASQSGNKIKDRCYIGAIGYGETQQVLTGGLISQVADAMIGTDPSTEMPLWIKPVANGTTPMAQSFQMAYQIVSQWASVNSESFPPIIINITDGEPDDMEAAAKAANQLMQLGTADGQLLLFNAHISGDAGATELRLPAPNQPLPNKYARFLFDISTPLPDTMLAAAFNEGFSPQPGARGFIFNAGAETLLKLVAFGSSGMR